MNETFTSCQYYRSCTLLYTPLGRFSVVDISTVGIVSVSKRSAFETSREELSEDVSFGVGTLLLVEQSTLHTVV